MVSLGVSTFLPGQPPAPEASDQPWQPVLISCMRDLPHTSTRRPVLILPASPEGDSEVQRHHVTYPEVAQQIYSRAESGLPGSSQAAFLLKGSSDTTLLPRVHSPGLLWELPGTNGGPCSVGAGSGWWAAGGTLWHLLTPGGRASNPPALPLPLGGTSFPESQVRRQALPQSAGQKAQN